MNCFFLITFATLAACCSAATTTTKRFSTPAPSNTTKNGKIIGGWYTDIYTFPYQLQLTTDRTYCGASIINAFWALSAAQCVINANYIYLRAGSSYWGVGGSVHYANQYSYHSYFDPQTLSNDISVIRVSNPFPIGIPGVAPVRLPYVEPAPYSNLIITGWGAYSYFRGPISYTLKGLIETVLNTYSCYQYYSSLPYNTICAMPVPGNGACSGDGGGPLASFATREQFGIMIGNDRCSTMRPDIYTSVALYRNWINYAMSR